MEPIQFKDYILVKGLYASNLLNAFRAMRRDTMEARRVELLPPGLSGKTLQNSLFPFLQDMQRAERADRPRLLDYGLFDKHVYMAKAYQPAKSLREVLDELNRQMMSFHVVHALTLLKRLITFFTIETQASDHFCAIAPEHILIAYDGDLLFDNEYLLHLLLKNGVATEKLGRCLAYCDPWFILQQRKAKGNILFSLGALLYEMLSGKALLPWQPDHYADAARNMGKARSCDFDEAVDDEVVDIINRLVSLDRQERFADIKAAKRALDIYLDECDYTLGIFRFVHFLNRLFPGAYEQESRDRHQERRDYQAAVNKRAGD